MSYKNVDQCIKARRPWWTLSDQMVAIAIASYVNDKGPMQGLGWPSTRSIAKITGLSRRRIQEVLRRLEKDKTIITTEQYLDNRQTSNLYEWMLDYGTKLNPIRPGRPLAAVPDLFSPAVDAAS